MPRFSSIDSYPFFGSGGETTTYKGATMLFAQASAPRGWTKETTFNDAMLRISSSTVGSGGALNFSTAMNSTYVTVTGSGSATNVVVGSVGLTLAQIPAHTHGTGVATKVVGAGGSSIGSGPLITTGYPSSATQTAFPSDGGGGASGAVHSHPGGSVSFTYNTTPKNMAVKYIDAIFATRNL